MEGGNIRVFEEEEEEKGFRIVGRVLFNWTNQLRGCFGVFFKNIFEKIWNFFIFLF